MRTSGRSVPKARTSPPARGVGEGYKVLALRACVSGCGCCCENETVASMQTSMDVPAAMGGAADSRVVSKAMYIFHAGSSASSDDSDAPACNPPQPLLATEQQAPLSERLLDNCRCTYCAEVQKNTRSGRPQLVSVGDNAPEPSQQSKCEGSDKTSTCSQGACCTCCGADRCGMPAVA